MQTRSQIARIASALAIAVILPVAILITMFHSGKKPLTQPGMSKTAVAANAPSKISPEEARKIAEQYGRLPMSFEPNQGQKAAEVKFYAHGPGYELFLASQEAVMAVHHSSAATKRAPLGAMRAEQRASLRSDKISVVRMKLDGSNPDAQIAGEAQLPGEVNYFIGNDPAKWHTDIPTFASVKYSGVYPGIDLVYYGNQKQLEYDFVVAPGADPKQIAFNVNGAKAVRLDKRGDLVLKTASGDVTFQKPVVYQGNAGERRQVAGNYVVGANHEVRFSLGAYDPSKALTIDPSVLIYSTYIGGSGTNGDFGYGIALDGAGDAWVTGTTSSSDFPQANGLTPVPPELATGLSAGFVTEVSPTGNSFLYSTYLGGSGNGNGGDGGYGLAVDTGGNVYVTGYTESVDFPVTANAAIGTAPATAATGSGSAFLTALHPATSGAGQLVYSSYLGGNGANGGFDAGYAVATDNNDNAYVTGVTTSTDYPTKNPIVPAQNSAFGNAFVTEINTTAAAGASVVFSSFLGGTGTGTPIVGYGDIGQAITVDTAGHTYVVGATTSSDFAPTPNSGSTPCGDAGFGTAFLVEIDTTVAAPTPLFSYCYGGAAGDTLALGVAIAPDKTAVVVGQTFTSDFPVTAGSIPVPAGRPNTTYSLGFVTKFNVTATPVVPYSTLLGGSSSDALNGVATDSAGNLYVGGASQSADFPVTQGALRVSNSNLNGTGTISKIDPLGGGASDLIYASYFGGTGQNNNLQIGDAVYAVAVSSANNAYIAGSTSSASNATPPFPISTGAAQTTLSNTTSNAFAAELPLVPTISISPVTLNFGSQPITVPTAPLYAAITNNTSASISLTIPPTFTGTNAADFTYSATAGAAGPACTTSIAAGSICTVGVTFTPSVAAAETGTMSITDGDDGTNLPLKVALSGTGTNGGPVIGINPTSLNFGGELIGASSTALPITVSNTGTAPLTISQIQSTSANFTETDGCTDGSIAPAGSCTINVTFAPQAGATVGPTTGSITITDNANGSPHSVAVSGTVWDFNLTVPATASVNKGSTAPFPVVINGLGGFAGNVTVGCTSAASNVASCAVNPSSGVPGATVMVTVTSTGMLAPIGPPIGTPPFAIRQLIFAAIAMMLLFLIPMTRRTRTRLGLAAAMLVFAVVAGCSGSAKTRSTTLTITGSSGSISKTYTVNLTVTG